MKRVYGITGADRAQNGNCFQACIASYLDIRLCEVPNFQVGAINGKLLPVAVRRSMDEWLAVRGFGYVEFAFPAFGSVRMNLQYFLGVLGQDFGSNFYLLTGRTAANKTHTVVCRGSEIFHDPATEVGNTVLVGPCHDDYYRVGVFLAISKPT